MDYTEEQQGPLDVQSYAGRNNLTLQNKVFEPFSTHENTEQGVKIVRAHHQFLRRYFILEKEKE
jgi:hypothetical protein